ncbi:UxaA family hydrolase [Psychrobacillus sp. FJAT-51614]|uniref:UxaA family hydrolase n=1 Tax=Psychrobacillus mangrovi TaxID=3117745 RepID=A0ABU8F183_9BACI
MSNLTFKGFARSDSSVGIRNYIGVVSTVVCSSVVTRDIAKTVPQGIPVVHANGCAQLGDDFLLTKNTLKGVVANPNIYASLLVGLGCETNQVSILLDETVESKPKVGFSIQQMAGGTNTLQAGSEIVKKWSEEIHEIERTEQGIEKLTIGILPIDLDKNEYQSASPSVSTFIKEMVESRATVILGMTDKMEKVLDRATSRAANEQVKAQMLSISSKNTRQTWDKMNPNESEYLQYSDADFQLGLEELKLAEGIDVASILNYAEIPNASGLHLSIMPNNVIEAASNLVASGCNLIVFLTNRAIFTGTIVVPCMTIGVMNKENQSVEMIDLVIDEHVTSSDILQKVIDISSGQLTKLEDFKLEEFAISHIGTTF